MDINRLRRLSLAVAIGLILYFAYLLSSTGIFKSGDELFLIDTTDSFALRSGPDRLLLNQTVHLRGLQTTDVEPAQPILAVPLYWAAYQIPWIGTIHALYLFNPLVTVATAFILYYYTLSLGYEVRTAALAMMLFGLTTIAWPYTKTFFRESLAMASLLAVTYFVHRWREAFGAHDLRREVLWFALGLISLLIAVLTKEAILIALPLLIIYAIPNWRKIAGSRHRMVIVAISLLVVGVTLIVLLNIYRTEYEAITARYEILGRLEEFTDGLRKSWYPALGYLFSPGRGVFWYSPVLILSLGAPFMLPYRRWRETWLPVVMLLAFVMVYGAVRRETWYGGSGWGPRYMVPIVPLLMIGALPLMQRILETKRIAPKVLFLGLIGAGLAVQIAAVYVNLLHYYGYQQEQTGLVPWSDTIIWSVRWSQAVGTIRYLSIASGDLLWLVPSAHWDAIAVIGTGLVLSFIGALYIYRAAPRLRTSYAVTAGIPILAAVITLYSLSRVYADTRYEGHNEALHALRATLAEEAGPEDIILLATPRYVSYFMNYYKEQPIWYSLPLSPGERYSCEQVPEVISDNVVDMVGPVTDGMMGRVYLHTDPVWLVVDNGPLVPCATRPVEHYFATSFFEVRHIDYTPLVRLVEFVPLRPPEGNRPEHRSDLRFGDSIVLHGYDLVVNRGERPDNLSAGDMLGVSLVWETEAVLFEDYTFAVYLIGPDGNVVLQDDRAPVGGFSPTTTWQPGERLRDNYGFVLPDALPPGAYELWTVIYRWPSMERLPVSWPDGAPLGDHVVLGSIEVR